jgi:transcriptional regulator with XRE-family HTH domain
MRGDVEEAVALVDFGARLAAALDRRGWNQRDLVRRSGLSVAVVSYSVNGLTNPTLSTLLRMREALGCGWDELLGP